MKNYSLCVRVSGKQKQYELDYLETEIIDNLKMVTK